MKNNIFTLLFMLGISIPSTFTQVFNYDWGMGFGDLYNNYAGQVIDAQKNIITFSSYGLATDLDPTSGSATITNAGSFDFFFAKYDQNGDFLWKRSFGNLNNEMIEDVKVDANSNIYITGQMQNGNIDFNPALPGTTVISASGTLKYDLFFAKYNPNGELVWLKTLQNPTEDEYALFIELDNANNVYVAGYFKGTLDFDPSASTANLTSMVGNKDIYLAKYDPLGNFLWVKQFTGSTYYELNGLVINHQNEVIVTSMFLDNVNFNPTGTGGSFSSIGHNPTAITKLNSSGNYLWTKVLDGPASDAYLDINALVVDAADNIYFAAQYDGTIDFDPSTGTDLIPAIPGLAGILFAKYDVNGNYQYAKLLGNGVASAIDVDQSNNVYVGGAFYNTVDFDVTAITANRTSTGVLADLFLAKYDQNLNLINVFTSGGVNNDNILQIHVIGNNEVYSTGSTSNQDIDVDPSATNQSFLKEGTPTNYVFWLKYTQCTNATLTETKSACGAYTWRNGTTYTANNNTATYTVSGAAAGGCDSVYTLNLTINPIANFTETKSACGSYTWRNGTTYTATNNTATYTVSGVAAGGCDSIYTLNLTINSVNISTSLSGSTISSNESGASYRWLDCNNNLQAIAGANNQSYSPSQNGYYAVEITKNACTDTSACVVISTLSLNENTLANATIYPNPFNDQFTLLFNELIQKGQVTVYDRLGQKVKEIDFEQKTDLDIQINTESGIYFVEIANEKGAKYIFKVVKY